MPQKRGGPIMFRRAFKSPFLVGKEREEVKCKEEERERVGAKTVGRVDW